MEILICGCDQYSPTWLPLAYSFNKYWKDCPWKKWFITNNMVAPKEFETIQTGCERGWGRKVKEALSKIKSDSILWMMEDFWIPGPVQTKTLLEFAQLMEDRKEIDHIRLMVPSRSDGLVVPRKELTEPTSFDLRLWHFKKSAEYRASMSLGFWRKKVLLSYLTDNMNPWEFEQEISAISGLKPNLYLCVVDPSIFPLCHPSNIYEVKEEIVTKGRWMAGAYDYAGVENLQIDFSHHPNGKRNENF